MLEAATGKVDRGILMAYVKAILARCVRVAGRNRQQGELIAARETWKLFCKLYVE